MEEADFAKQLTWVLLLRAHCAVGYVGWMARAFCGLIGTVRKRLTSLKKGEARAGLLCRLISLLQVISMVILALEVFAHLKKWNEFSALDDNRHGFLHMVYLTWLAFRADHIAPAIRVVSKFFIVLCIIQSADRMMLFLGWLGIRCCKIKPRLDENMLELKGYEYPKVLVQIPMCNEREVYEHSISAACQLDWPKGSLLIQVLDDSDDESIQQLIQQRVSWWRQEGTSIIYHHRLVRAGYKAGNLKSGMNYDYVNNYEFVVIFDADFLPKPDFLKQTVPYFKNDPDLGLVQARWTLLNKDENLLTRLQNINMCSHFELEQQVNGVFLNFFGFNGTAGVWRIQALEESGGWLERTTVEDMDIAVRAHLKGWKFIFVNDVKVSCEVPELYDAYRKQQHRWHSGPVRLFCLCLPDILSCKIALWKKANMIFLFFLLRKLILPLCSFTLVCIILPLTMFVPEAQLPLWLLYYLPVTMSFLNSLPASKSFHFAIPYLLFENTMSVAKFDAVVSGFLGSSYEWVVTKKAGRASELKKGKEREANNQDLEKSSSVLNEEKVKAGEISKRVSNICMEEVAVACLLLIASMRSLLSGEAMHFCFLFLQGLAFLVVGLDLISEQIS